MNALLNERIAQDKKWGEQNHDLMTWMTILGEEYGEACKAVLHDKFDGHRNDEIVPELVQVAAVAMVILDYIMRKRPELTRETDVDTGGRPL